ncbi:hypothetical protein WOLCODRAFT_164438, partial [Wolfiporia cocos MD-104 SS10]
GLEARPGGVCFWNPRLARLGKGTRYPARIFFPRKSRSRSLHHSAQCSDGTAEISIAARHCLECDRCVAESACSLRAAASFHRQLTP